MCTTGISLVNKTSCCRLHQHILVHPPVTKLVADEAGLSWTQVQRFAQGWNCRGTLLSVCNACYDRVWG